MARSLTAPDGVRWKLRRRWSTPELRRRGSPDGRLDTIVDALGGDVLVHAGTRSPLQLVFALPAVALVVSVPFLIVYFAAGPAALAAVVVALVALAVTYARRRTWTVHAEAGGREHGHVWRVRGWRASRVVADRAAEALRTGGELPPRALTYGAPPAPLPEVGSRR